jgi:dihydroflavonol-4-reductase
MTSVVLGANGHIGCHVTRELASRGHCVRAFVRAGTDLHSLEGVEAEVQVGDVLDRESVARALDGAETAYHLASPSSADPQIERIAVEGTRHVAEAVLASRSVSRLIYTSSTITVGWTSDPRARLDESSFSNLSATPNQVAKCRAEALVLAQVRERGLPAVIVNPATTLGPLNYRPTPANRLVTDFLNGRVHFTFDGGFTVVDVRDVARGMVLAAEKGRLGDRYILGGPQVTVRQLYRELAQVSGLPAPRLHLPRWAVLMGALGMEGLARVVRRHPPVTYRLMKAFVGSYSFHDSGKAAAELGYTWLPLDEILQRAVRWFVDSGLVSASRARRVRLAA